MQILSFSILFPDHLFFFHYLFNSHPSHSMTRHHDEEISHVFF
jgi:hypothetical protein